MKKSQSSGEAQPKQSCTLQGGSDTEKNSSSGQNLQLFQSNQWQQRVRTVLLDDGYAGDRKKPGKVKLGLGTVGEMSESSTDFESESGKETLGNLSYVDKGGRGFHRFLSEDEPWSQDDTGKPIESEFPKLEILRSNLNGWDSNRQSRRRHSTTTHRRTMMDRSASNPELGFQNLREREAATLVATLMRDSMKDGFAKINPQQAKTLFQAFFVGSRQANPEEVTSRHVQNLAGSVGDDIKEFLMREYAETNNSIYLRRYSSSTRSASELMQRSTPSPLKGLKDKKYSSSLEERPFLLPRTMSAVSLRRKRGMSVASLSFSDLEEVDTDSMSSVDATSKAEEDFDEGDYAQYQRGEYGDPVGESKINSSEREELCQCLMNIDSWDFDIFRVSKLSGTTGPIVIVGFALFERHGIFDTFSVDEETAISFLANIQAKYQSNPYHNRIHAADTAQTLSYFFVRGGFHNYSDDLTRFATLFAAIVHDVRHPGVTNNFLVSTGHPLALRYNDRSPLENMHAATAFETMSKAQCNILKNMSQVEAKMFRHLAIMTILATDNAEHNNILSRLGTLVRKLRKSQGTKVSTPEDDSFIMSVALHAADISSSAKPWRLYSQWSERVCVEFRLQGDMERDLGLPVLPFMDRNSNEPIAGIQSGFIKAICLPLYEKIFELPNTQMEHAKLHILSNLETWGSTAKERRIDPEAREKKKKLLVKKALRKFTSSTKKYQSTE